MKKFRLITLNIALLALLAGGIVSASAKESGSKRARIVRGVIERIDTRARTIDVREYKTGQLFTIRVPEGQTVATNNTITQNLTIEQLLEGMSVRRVLVK